MGKSWYQSKTLWTNLTALIGGVGVFIMTGNPEGLVASGMGILNIVLRLVTKQPIG